MRRPRPGTAICCAVLALWFALALVSPLLDTNPAQVDLTALFASPSPAHWLGADDLGRSIAARVLAGARVSCLVAIVVVATAAVLGTAIGMSCAWFGGAMDLAATRVMEIFMAFPGILLAIGLAGVLGPGLPNVIIALCTVSWVGFARLARVQTLSLKHRDHVLVARALGTPTGLILLRHVLPLAAAPLIVEATFALGVVVVAEAGLSFLGLGVQPPTASWGSMIKDATQFLLVAPHMIVGPGLAMLSLVVAVNVLGDRLRDHWRVAR